MKFLHLVSALALVVGAAACKKKEGAADQTADKPTTGEGATTGTEAAKPAGARDIPNGQGLVVDAPAKWLDNGIGGAAGMHLDNDGGSFQVRETSAEEAAKPFATFKSETEEIMFQKWITAEETPDGFKTIYVQDKIAMKGDEAVKDGSTFAFHVRRKIDGKAYDCDGPAATQEIAAEAVDLCMKVKKS